jgi:hypothetical protein
LDGFHLDFADGSYQCLVHKLLGIRLKDIWLRLPIKVSPEQTVKLTLTHALIALDFLRSEAWCRPYRLDVVIPLSQFPVNRKIIDM